MSDELVSGLLKNTDLRVVLATTPELSRQARATHGTAPAAAALADLVAALERHGARRIAMVGGGAAAIRPYLPEGVAAALSPALGDARDGALLLAAGRVAGAGSLVPGRPAP